MISEDQSIFQLSILSQNDQPNSLCAGCSSGANIITEVLTIKGGTFLNPQNPTPNYPVSNEKMNTPVQLPIPSKNPPPTPTWFFKIDGELDDLEITCKVNTPEYEVLTIKITGREIQKWVADNYNGQIFTPINQVFKKGDCGIFGVAQYNEAGNPQFAYWIYTITAGVCNPKGQPVVNSSSNL